MPNKMPLTTYRMVMRPSLIRREYPQQWGEHQDGCQPARA